MTNKMVKYFLELNFDSAKLYRDFGKKGMGIVGMNSVSKKAFQNKALVNRDTNKTMGSFIEPITYFQISNVLSALTGNRPVNTIKFENDTNHEIFNHNSKYIEWAKESYITYDNQINTYFNTKGEAVLIREFKKTGDKIFYNCNSDKTRLSWFDIEYYLKIFLDNKGCYEKLEAVKKHYSIDSTKHSFNDLIEKACDKKDFSVLFNWIEEIRKVGAPRRDGSVFSYVLSYCIKYDELGCGCLRKEGIKDVETKKPIKQGPINKTVYGFDFTDVNTLAIASIRTKNDIYIGTRILNGISGCENYSGRILIPIFSDDDLKLFENNSGTATILDGGVITINSLKTPYNVKLDKFTKMSEISIEREKIK